MWDFITPSHYIDISSVLDVKVLLTNDTHDTHDTHTTHARDCLLMVVNQIKSWLEHKTQYPNSTAVSTMLTGLGQRVAANTGATNVRLAEGLQIFS